MMGRTLADFLVRAVLDDEFRELAVADPQCAFDGYDLSEQEKEILTSRDSRLLGLLGDAMASGERVALQSSASEHVEASMPAVPSLPEVKLLLRLAPQLVETPKSGPQVAYAASLHPWPADDKPVSGFDTAEQADSDVEAAGQELTWVIRMVPTVVGVGETQMEVSYSASIDRLMTDPGESQVPGGKAKQDSGGAPWNHHVESVAAKTAAQSVRAADPDQRYAKLLDLVHALQTGDGGG